MATLSEPVTIPDVFVSCLALIEDVGEGNYRFTFAVPESVYGVTEYTAKAKIIIPMGGVLAGMKATTAFIGLKCATCVGLGLGVVAAAVLH